MSHGKSVSPVISVGDYFPFWHVIKPGEFSATVLFTIKSCESLHTAFKLKSKSHKSTDFKNLALTFYITIWLLHKSVHYIHYYSVHIIYYIFYIHIISSYKSTSEGIVKRKEGGRGQDPLVSTWMVNSTKKNFLKIGSNSIQVWLLLLSNGSEFCRWSLNLSFRSLLIPTSWNIRCSLAVYSNPQAC